MDKIDPQAVANQLQNGQTDKQQRYLPTLRQEKLIAALWQRMGDLYGSKWESQQGPPKMESGPYSATFLLWARKTADLKDEQFKRGFDQLEYLVKEAARYGEEIWPPSYAGFIGYCEKAHGTMGHRYFPPIGIENKTKREKDREIAKVEVQKLKALFSSEDGQDGNKNN